MGVVVPVRLMPRGGRDAVEGWASGADGKRHLKARVSAPPEAGKANAALIALVARTLGVAKSAVTVASGAGARLKRLAVAGDEAALRERLRQIGDAP
jgi:uncharacterized protein YggU (UPF0235/DUF167 family)